MYRIIFFLITILSFKKVQNLGCKDAKIEQFCNQMPGCTFNKTCNGNFSPLCPKNQQCYFIYQEQSQYEKNSTIIALSESSTDIQSYESFEDAYKQAANDTNCTLYGFNLPNLKFKINETIVLKTFQLSIQPYFTFLKMNLEINQDIRQGNSIFQILDNPYTLNLQNINLSCIQRSMSIVSNTGGYFFLKDVVISEDFNPLNGAIFSAEQPKLIQVQGLIITNIQSLILRIVGNQKDCEIQVNQLIINSTNANFMNSLMTIFGASKLSISNINLQGLKAISSSNNPLINLQSISNLTIQNATISNMISSMIFYLQNVQSVTFEGCKFIEVVCQQVFSLRNSNFQKSDDSKAIFGNISLNNTVVFKNTIFIEMFSEVTITDSIMENIAYQDDKSLNSLFNLISNGICGYFHKVPTVIIEESIFKNISQNCLLLAESELHTNELIFYQNDENVFYNASIVFDVPPSMIFGQQSLTGISSGIINSIFLSDQPYILQTAILISSTTWIESLNIEDCIFINMSSISNGGAIQFQINNYVDSSIVIKNNIFNSNDANYNGGAISIEQQKTPETVHAIQKDSQVIINTNIFAGCSSEFGGALFLNCLYCNVDIDNSIAIQNQASYAGAYFLQAKQLQTNDKNIILWNFAYNSGGASINFCKDEINKNIFGLNTTNFNQYGQNSIQRQKPTQIHIDIYEYIANTLLLGSYTGIDLIENKFVKYQKTIPYDELKNELVQYKSSHAIPYFYRLRILDSKGQLVDYITSFELQLGQSMQSLSFFNGIAYLDTDFTFSFSFDDLFSISINNQEISASFLNQCGFIVSTNLNLNSTTCNKGDVYKESVFNCIPCKNYTFNYLAPKDYDYDFDKSICHECPKNMICLGQNVTVPKIGYYKLKENDTTAYPCENLRACLGGIHNRTLDPLGNCMFPYKGELCSFCEDGYVKSSSNSECIKCDGSFWYFFRLVLKILIIVIIVVLELIFKRSKEKRVKEACESENEEAVRDALSRYDQSAVFKLILTYSQMIDIINSLNYSQAQSLSQFLHLLGNINPKILDQFSVDCLYYFNSIDNDKIFYYNYLILLLEPFIFILLLAILFGLRYLWSRKSFQFKEYMYSTLIMLFYINQPQILLKSLNLFKCKSYGENGVHLDINYKIECNSDFYFHWSIGIGLPSVIIFGVFYPLLLFLSIRKKIKYKASSEQQLLDSSSTHKKSILNESKELTVINPKNYKFVSNYAFVIGGFKLEKWYWEFIIMGRKFFMVLVVISSSIIGLIGQSIPLILILAISYVGHIYHKPYTNKTVAYLDTLGMVATILIILNGEYEFAIQGEQTDQQHWYIKITSIALYSFIIIVSFVFLIKSMIFLWHGYKKEIQRKIIRVVSNVHYKINQPKTKKMPLDINFRNSTIIVNDEEASSSQE